MINITVQELKQKLNLLNNTKKNDALNFALGQFNNSNSFLKETDSVKS